MMTLNWFKNFDSDCKYKIKTKMHIFCMFQKPYKISQKNKNMTIVEKCVLCVLLIKGTKSKKKPRIEEAQTKEI